MGRSRAVLHSTDDDQGSHRSKRRKTASTADNLEGATAGQGMSEGKRASYHCNYCSKDISGKIRTKCVVCPDFDLCIECFSIGAEVTPHVCFHPYRVMDNLSFPLICPDWNADEEMLLLEGIEMYGLGNWSEVSEHVGTKRKSECIDHYVAIYMNSPCFPLPDMSHVLGKTRAELLAMARGEDEVKKGSPTHGELTLKVESPLSARVKVEESRKEEIQSDMVSSSTKTSAGAVKRASNMAQVKDGRDNIKVEETQTDRSVGEKKPRTSGDEGPSVTELSGYNFKRQEFDVEYDNDAEQLLADMEFKDADTDAEHELKLQVLHIYSKRLDERKRRKDFILERNLLYPDPFEKNLSPEERDVNQRFKVFMRFHSKEEHEELLRVVLEEHWIQKRIQDLQDARAAGCRTSAEAERYLEEKGKKEAEESAQQAKESAEAGPSGGKVLQRVNTAKGESDGSPRRGGRGSADLEPGIRDTSSTTAGHAILRSLDVWDITGFPGEDLLSETEKQLCSEIRILPSHYLNMLHTMLTETLNGNITRKSDAHGLFKVEPSKVDKVYDMFVKKGIVKS